MKLSEDFFKWVEAHAKYNPSALRLKYAGKNDSGIDYSEAITQIECRRKFAVKLNLTLAEFPEFFFPSMLAGEQSTSDLLAAFHTNLIEAKTKVADMTAGLGIDVFHFCRKAENVVAVELDNSRVRALEYNAHGLGLNNLKVIHGDCRDFVDDAINKEVFYDCIFIDPARRAEDGKRVFALADCKPDVTVMLPEIAKICSRLIVKASPMLDITHCIRTIGTGTEKVIALGTPTECKELVIVVSFTKQYDEPRISAVTLSDKGTSSINFTQSEELIQSETPFGRQLQAGDYIYEPYPAVMKSGAFNVLCNRYGLWKFNQNTKILYSDNLIADFPGNIYRVQEVLPYASKVIKRLKSRYPVANIATRNFGLSADALRAKLGIKDGGNVRIYGYTDSRENKMLAITEKD